MAERDIYTSDQLAKIRATLEETLGDSSSGALENLDNRFVARDSIQQEEEQKPKKKKKSAPEGGNAGEGAEDSTPDVSLILAEDKLQDMLNAVPTYKDKHDDIRALTQAILNHRDLKAFHLVDTLSKIDKSDVELVNALVAGITSRKGVNPLIEAMRHATESSDAVKALAMSVAEQGTVNHIIRAIATAPQGIRDAEIIWSMEVIGKGSVEQILEAIKLLDPTSPGAVILATGLVNRKEVSIEPLVRALAALQNNEKACSILSVALTQLADIGQLVSLLEKYVTDDTEAAEILVTKLVYLSTTSKKKGDDTMMAKVCGFMRGESLAGKILVMGIVEHGLPANLEKAYARMKAHPIGQQMAAIGIKNKVGGMKAMKLLGGAFFQTGKYEGDVRAAMAEGKRRYNEVMNDILKIAPEK